MLSYTRFVSNVSIITGVILLSQCVIQAAEYLPAERGTSWQAGIPGGIPEVTSPVIDAVDEFNIPNDSSADATASLQAALDAAAANGGSVVYLNEGIYRIDGVLKFNGDNIILRGAGPDLTKLYLGYAGDAIFVGMYGRGEWQRIASATKGVSTVTVTDGALFTPGEYAEMQQLNDTALMITDPDWDVDWARNMIGQMFEVVSVDDNKVTFRSPLHFQPRNDRSPEIRPQRLRHHCGIEQLYLRKTANDGHTIIIKNAAYCWVRQIEGDVTRKAHIETAYALGCQFSENYLHHSISYGGGGSGYGTSLHTHTSDCLVENNIFNHLRHAMIIQNGAVGNVFAYNFSTDPVQGESDNDSLNKDWDPPDLSFHGHYAQYNLCEGNIVTEIGISDHWGPMGPGNTFFRNEATGQDGMYIRDHSHRQNIIGNRTIAWNDDATSEELLFHGNIIGNDPVQWDASTGLANDLPPSLFLEEKPACWNDTLPWPGTGSDITQVPVNPAKSRWENGSRFTESSSLRKPKCITNSLQRSVDVSFEFSRSRFILHSPSSGSVQLFTLSGKRVYHLLKAPATWTVHMHLARGVYRFRWISARNDIAIAKNIIIP